jgi:hypothetical protein
LGLGLLFHQAFLDRDLSQEYFLRQQASNQKSLCHHLHRQNLLVVGLGPLDHLDRLHLHHQRKLLLKNLNRRHYFH